MWRKMGRRRAVDPGARRHPRRTAERPGDDHRARRPRARIWRDGVEAPLGTAAPWPRADARGLACAGSRRMLPVAARTAAPRLGPMASYFAHTLLYGLTSPGPFLCTKVHPF